MLEEESLYVELKRMEQTERRYRSDREELMRVMGGLDSGVIVPGEQGNRAFGRGEVIGIGLARGSDGSVLADKLKKRRRGEDGEPTGDVEMPPPPPPKKKVDPMFGERQRVTTIIRTKLTSEFTSPCRRTKQHHPPSTSTRIPPILPSTRSQTSSGDQDQRPPRRTWYLYRPLGHAHEGQRSWP
jgi:hypothetical protein